MDLGPLWVASLYMPSGTSGHDRQLIKFDFLNRYTEYLTALQQQKKPYIICGDFNIAHQAIDLKNLEMFVIPGSSVYRPYLTISNHSNSIFFANFSTKNATISTTNSTTNSVTNTRT